LCEIKKLIFNHLLDELFVLVWIVVIGSYNALVGVFFQMVQLLEELHKY